MRTKIQTYVIAIALLMFQSSIVFGQKAIADHPATAPAATSQEESSQAGVCRAAMLRIRSGLHGLSTAFPQLAGIEKCDVTGGNATTGSAVPSAVSVAIELHFAHNTIVRKREAAPDGVGPQQDIYSEVQAGGVLLQVFLVHQIPLIGVTHRYVVFGGDTNRQPIILLYSLEEHEHDARFETAIKKLMEAAASELRSTLEEPEDK